MNKLPIVIIGAGPIGLAAACRLLERGETPIVFESAGTAAATVREWGHVRMFSSWAMNIDTSAAALLSAHGWQRPVGEGFPTGSELVRDYLEPLATLPLISRCIRYSHKVVAVTRWGFDKLKNGGRVDAPFEVRIQQRSGDQLRVLARAVIDASGTWNTPSPAGHSGLPAVGEAGSPRVAYGIPDVRGGYANWYSGKDVAVIGGGHSAINVLLDLVEQRGDGHNALTWITRGPMPVVQGGGTAVESLLPERGSALAQLTALVKRGSVKAVSDFALEEVQQIEGRERLLLRGQRQGRNSLIETDELIACTGFRPDLRLLRELQMDLDPWLESSAGVGKLIREAAARGQAIPQPYGAATLCHPEQNIFVVGMKSHGRAPNFFLFYGYEQVRSIAAWLCGDFAAAERVEFQLPEGAVCGGCDDGACCGSVGGAQSCGSGSSGCCGSATQGEAKEAAPASCCG